MDYEKHSDNLIDALKESLEYDQHHDSDLIHLEQLRAQTKAPRHMVKALMKCIFSQQCGSLLQSSFRYVVRKERMPLKETILSATALGRELLNLEKALKEKELTRFRNAEKCFWELLRHSQAEGKRILLFFAPYYSEDRINDGYFQRIKAIDDFFGDRAIRIYASWLNAMKDQVAPNIRVWDDLHLEIEYSPLAELHNQWIIQLAQFTKIVYLHSVTFANEKVTLLPDVQKLLDVHGAYPEEERMYGKETQAGLDEHQEKLLMEHGNLMICVTESMISHMLKKYPNSRIESLLLPIHSAYPLQTQFSPRNPVHNKPVVIYSGGVQKWQCIDEVFQAIEAQKDHYVFKLFGKASEELTRRADSIQGTKDIQVGSLTKAELDTEYDQCHYGFILRKDSVVNAVACPTKLVEYLQHGIVPIMDSTKLGDFVGLGMKYISIEDFINNRMPDEQERIRIANHNVTVLRILRERFESGREKLVQRTLHQGGSESEH